MSKIGDNDGALVLVRQEDGRSVDRINWSEARERLAAFLCKDTSNPGWAESEAEDMLCALFTGAIALEETQP
jgi:hypothetical protein